MSVKKINKTKEITTAEHTCGRLNMSCISTLIYSEEMIFMALFNYMQANKMRKVSEVCTQITAAFARHVPWTMTERNHATPLLHLCTMCHHVNRTSRHLPTPPLARREVCNADSRKAHFSHGPATCADFFHQCSIFGPRPCRAVRGSHSRSTHANYICPAEANA